MNTPSHDAVLAADDVAFLRQHRFHELQEQMSQDLRTPETVDSLDAMAAMFPDTPQNDHLVVVGDRTFRAGNERTSDLTLEYHLGSKWLLANVVAQEFGGRRIITGFHITPIDDSLENLNRLTLRGKTELEYDTLIVAVISVLVSLYVFILCLRTRGLKRKWLWLIVTLVGIIGFGVNWTTGEYAFMPLMFRLPPAGASATLYGPWTVFVTVPVGAITFLALRSRLSRSV